MYFIFYCTHAITPLLFITGRRAVKVTGFESSTCGHAPASLGYRGGAGIQMITLDNGAILRCINSGFKREPFEKNLNYTIYGTKGTLETHAIHDHNISVYRESDKFCQGTTEDYYPKRFIAPEGAQAFLNSASKLTDIFSEGTINTGSTAAATFIPAISLFRRSWAEKRGHMPSTYIMRSLPVCAAFWLTGLF